MLTSCYYFVFMEVREISGIQWYPTARSDYCVNYLALCAEALCRSRRYFIPVRRWLPLYTRYTCSFSFLRQHLNRSYQWLVCPLAHRFACLWPLLPKKKQHIKPSPWFVIFKQCQSFAIFDARIDSVRTRTFWIKTVYPCLINTN